MKRLFLAAAITLLLSGGLGVAQDPILESDLQYQPSPSDIHVQPGVSPQMWLYLEEMKRQDDPALAVRRKAEYRANQRMKRIAAREWFGISTARPQTSVTPFTTNYSRYWGGNIGNSFRSVTVDNVWTIGPH